MEGKVTRSCPPRECRNKVRIWKVKFGGFSDLVHGGQSRNKVGREMKGKVTRSCRPSGNKNLTKYRII